MPLVQEVRVRCSSASCRCLSLSRPVSWHFIHGPFGTLGGEGALVFAGVRVRGQML
jgi:hypothetical protein